MTKKWVFDSLVKDSSDVTGLLAYALYKHRKSNLAKAMREQGKSEEEIAAAMQFFHTQTITGVNHLQAYEKEALSLLDEIEKKIREPIVEKISLENRKEIERLKSEHIKELKKQKVNISRKFEQFKVEEEQLKEWLLSSARKYVGNAFGNLIVLIFLAGLILFLSPSTLKEIIIDEVIAKPMKDALKSNELIRR